MAKTVQLIALILAAFGSTQLATATHHPLHCSKWQRNCQKYDQHCSTQGSTEKPVQKSCCDILRTYESSGDFFQDNTRGLANDIYLLKRNSYSTSLAYCDMTTAEGGWMVILRRADGQEDFNRYYDEFEDGFGELDRDFFYGLKALNELTACDNWAPQTNWVLRIDFYNNSNDTESSAHATYNNFTIGCKDEGYPLQLGKFEPSEPTLRDNLSEFEKQKFVALKPFEARPTCLSGGNSGAWWYKEDKCKSSFGSVLTVPYQHLGWYEYEQDNRERNYGKYELKIRRENCLSSINSSQ